MNRWWVVPCAVLAFAAAAFAVDPTVVRQHVDEQWIRNSLDRDVARPFADVGQRANGFFRADIGDHWTVPASPSLGLQMSQGRSIYAMDVASRWLAGDPAYANTARYATMAAKGCDFLLQYDRSPVGGWYWGFNANGTVPTDNTWDKYSANQSIGIAAVGMGLARTYGLTGDMTYWNAAKDAWNVLDTRLRDAWGNPTAGKVYNFSGEIVSSSENRPNMNHLMHTFETLQHMYAVAPAADKQTFGDALREWGNDLVNNAYRDRPGYSNQGYFPDVFDRDPTTGAFVAPAIVYQASNPSDPANTRRFTGGQVNCGHSIETAFFLSRGVELLEANGQISADEAEAWLTAAEKTLNYAIATGYDGERHVLYAIADYDGNLRAGQTIAEGAKPDAWMTLELLRATMHWAAVRGRSDLWDEFDAALAMAQVHMIDAADGGWCAYDRFNDGKSSTWGGPYHDAMFYDEALRLVTIPEPATLALLACGAAMLVRRRRRA